MENTGVCHSFRRTHSSSPVGHRGILRELGPTLLPTEDLENLAAAEAAVASKHDERDEVINKLNVELNGGSRPNQNTGATGEGSFCFPCQSSKESKERLQTLPRDRRPIPRPTSMMLRCECWSNSSTQPESL